jgi:hypothetical protein
MVSTLRRSALLPLLALCCAQAALAQAPEAGAAAERPGRPEPRVQRIVIEDDNARIEELRVRGATRDITVTPKHGPGLSYQVVPVDAGRDQNAGPSNARGSAGKSQFRVLSF